MELFLNASWRVWLGAFLVFSGLAGVVWNGLAARREQRRWSHVRHRVTTVAVNARAATLAVGRGERLVAPALDAIAGLVQKVVRPSWLADTELLLERVGPNRRLTPRRFLAFKGLLAPVGFLLGAAIGARLSPDMQIFVGVGFAVMLFKLPDLWISRRADARTAKITRELPDVLDQMTISVGAGLGLEAAMSRVADRASGPFSAELRRTMQDLRIGIDRQSAYESLARRTGSEDVQTLVGSILQGIELGMPLTPILEARATELRRKRRARAEEQAQKLSVKLTFPTAMCILPALLLVVIGPAVLTVVGSEFGG